MGGRNFARIRASLAGAPGTINAGSHTLSLTNPSVDQLIPALLLGQVNYPNDQLTVSNQESIDLAREWISAFFQHDVNGNSFRITSITPTPSAPSAPSGSNGSGSGATAPSTPAGGAPPPPDPLCALVGGHC